MSDVVEQQVVVQQEDAKSLKEFLEFFEIGIIPEMEEVLKKIESTKTEHMTMGIQKELLAALCRTVAYGGHPMFQDEVLKDMISQCAEISDDYAFKQQFEAEAGSEEV